MSLSLDAQLGTAPMTTLGVVSDFVVCPEANPVWYRPILLGLLGQHPLDAEGLVGRHFARSRKGFNEKEDHLQAA